MRNKQRRKSIIVILLVLVFTFSTVYALTSETNNPDSSSTSKIEMDNNEDATVESLLEEDNGSKLDTEREQTEESSSIVNNQNNDQQSSNNSSDTDKEISVDEYETNRFIVKYKEDDSIKGMRTMMAGEISEAKVLKRSKFGVISVKSKIKQRDLLKKLKAKKADALIEYIQPDYTMTISADDKYFVNQWGLQNKVETFANIYKHTVSDAIYDKDSNNNKLVINTFSGFNNGTVDGTVYSAVYEEVYNGAKFNIDVNVLSAWEFSEGEGVVVAVLDTGIDITHEDLRGNIWINEGEIPNNGKDDDGNGYIDDINGWSFSDNANSVHNETNASDEWHGTHIAGIIAAVKDNEKGIAGIAPKTNIMPLKVFKNGIAYTSDIIKAIEYAKDNGARIVNCSWGTTYENTALKEAMEESGLIFVCAAGNSNNNIDLNPVYPSAFESANIISVASTNRIGQLSGFSNYGPKSVDVAAPGEGIMSTLPNNRYGQSSGTSMSTAFVTGEAALLLSKYQDLDSNGLKEKIINSSDSLYTLFGKVLSGNKINCSSAVSDNELYKDMIIAFSGTGYQDAVSNFVYSNGSEYELYSIAS